MFAGGFIFLGLVRHFTGKTLHGGQDPLGWIEFCGYAIVVAFFVWGTHLLHRWVHRSNPIDLGLALSSKRLVEFMIGVMIGAVLNGWMWVLSLVIGTARITDKITYHYGPETVAGLVALGVVVALLNGLLEETTSRAFPARLFEDRSLPFRVTLLAVFFALQHLVDEPFRIGRLLYLAGFGGILTVAYIWRGNIWPPLGLHVGYLLASIVPGGRWHLGSVYDLTGQYAVPLWLYDSCMVLAAIVLTVWMYRRTRLRLSRTT